MYDAAIPQLEFGAYQTHRDTEVLSTDPLEIVTPAPQWSYTVWRPFAAAAPPSAVGASILVTVEIEVRRGAAGVGWNRSGSDDFVVEKYAKGEGRHVVRLRVSHDATPGRVMVRNVSAAGPSHLVVHAVSASHAASVPYPVTVEHRHLGTEETPADCAIVFEDELARSINRARLDFLGSLGMPLAGKRVLDVGCGVGHHSAFYTQAGAEVVGVDGRPENIDAMATLYPKVTGVVGDAQTIDLTALGSFDIVHCFGLLYHLESPVAALRRLATVCRGLLILETMVCDAVSPLMVLADESGSANQALDGLGCRPSPSFVAMALDRIGFAHVYGTTAPPDHPDFLFEWRNSLDTARDGHNLRCIFLASRSALACPHLVPLISLE